MWVSECLVWYKCSKGNHGVLQSATTFYILFLTWEGCDLFVDIIVIQHITDETEHDVRGITWGRCHPCLFQLEVRRGDHKHRGDHKRRCVQFLLGTCSPHTSMSKEALEAFSTSNSRPNESTTIAVRVNSINVSISMTLEDGYFADTNVLRSATAIVHSDLNVRPCLECFVNGESNFRIFWCKLRLSSCYRRLPKVSCTLVHEVSCKKKYLGLKGPRPRCENNRARLEWEAGMFQTICGTLWCDLGSHAAGRNPFCGPVSSLQHTTSTRPFGLITNLGIYDSMPHLCQARGTSWCGGSHKRWSILYKYCLLVFRVSIRLN